MICVVWLCMVITVRRYIIHDGMTARLQPNDVGVYGPLTQIVSRMWLDQTRDDPDEWDSMVHGVERYLEAWTQQERDVMRQAWVTAVPQLGAMASKVRYTSM